MFLRWFMNKRKEPITARMQKKENKEVRKGLKEGDTLLPKTPKRLKETLLTEVSKEKKLKKTSKRTSPDEKIEGSTPAHLHTENERWSMLATRQSLLKANRLRKKMAKKTVRPGR